MNDSWSIEPELRLYELTFPEVLKTDKHTGDWTGIIFAGRSKKGVNAPNKDDVFLRWQKDVQMAARDLKVSPEVMAYFQASKHLRRAPKRGEIEVETPADYVEALAHDVAVKVAKEYTPPRFTWSPSKIMQFQTCPYQFAAQNYYKTLPYQETEQTRWGIRVHKAAEDFMLDKPVTDPEGFAPVAKWCKLLSKIKGERLVEHKMAVDSKFQPTGWETAEGRMILDFGVLKDDGELLLVDWKTGKVKDDDIQMRIYALISAIEFPQVKRVSYKYIWAKHDTVTGGELERKDLLPVAKDLQSRLSRMREAWENEVFVQKKNGLCRQWCGVTECPNRGR